MPAATHTTTIPTAPDAVFAFVADGATAPRWRSGVMDVARVSGDGVGTVYKQGTKGPGGHRVDADYEITTYEPPHRLAFRVIAGPVRPVGEYVFEAVPEGTRLTFSLSAELGGLKRFLMGSMVQSTMNAEVQAIERIPGAMAG
jgi:uncharacterized protein YndB with AHSA1/START domain